MSEAKTRSEAGEKLRKRAGDAVADRVDVRALQAQISSVTSRDVSELLDELIEARKFEAASAVVLAAGLADRPVDAVVLDPLFGDVDSVAHAGLLARSVTGDVTGTLWRVIEQGHLSHEREALACLLIAKWSDDVPPGLISFVRTLSRKPTSSGVQLCIAECARLIGDEQLDSVVGANIPFAAAVARSEGYLTDFLESPVLEALPERAPRSVVRGRTVRTAGDDVGRNDPCPCGSGRKYKKCCLRKPRAAQSAADNAGAVEVVLTDEQVASLRTQELLDLDLTRLSDHQLRIAFNRAWLFQRFDVAEKVLTEMEERDLSNVDDYRTDLVHEHVEAGRLDEAQRQAERLRDGLPADLELDFVLSSNAEVLAQLERYATEALGERGGGVDLAYSFLRQYPALGIFVARGAMSSHRLLDAEMLAETIEEARDRLNLPAGDRAQELLDFVCDRRLESNIRARHALSLAREARMVDESRELRDKYRKARKRREELEDRLRDYEEKLRRIEEEERKSEVISASKKNEPASVRQTGTEPAPGADNRDLRRKIDHLKGIISEKNSERMELRRQITELSERLEEAAESSSPSPQEDPFDELEDAAMLDDRASRAVCLMPSFSRDFQDQLAQLPVEIARRAVRICAELATTDTVQWRDVKRMQATDVFTSRITLNWRLIFRLRPDDDRLEAMEVISREDFDRVLKKYRRASSKRSN